MISLIAIILLIIALRVIFLIKTRRDRMPTDKEVNEKSNRWNLMALKRSNKR